MTATVEVLALHPDKHRATLRTVCTVAGQAVLEGEAYVSVPSRQQGRRRGMTMPVVITDWRPLPPALRGATVALGNMDGVHRGHGRCWRRRMPRRPAAPLAVLTFEPHPREHFRPEDPPFRLTPLPAKAAVLGAAGAALVVALPFDAALAAMPAEQFFETVLRERLGAVHLACGQDFAFGHRRGGDAATAGAAGGGGRDRADGGAAGRGRAGADFLHPHPPRACRMAIRNGRRRCSAGPGRSAARWCMATSSAGCWAGRPPISGWAGTWSRRAGSMR